MLLSHFGVEIDQEKIIEASGIKSKIKEWGMTVSEMAVALRVVVPGMVIWSKTDSRISELQEIVRRENYPVGINWQGIFDDFEDDYEDEDEDEDEGHYSMAIDVDTVGNRIRIVDPYGHYINKDREFSIVKFEKRWWDEDWEIDLKTKKKVKVYHNRQMFIILPESVTFAADLGMKRW